MCDEKGHCILPATPGDERLDQICENVTNVGMMIVYEVNNHEEKFMLLFKHFLESKELKSMIRSG